MSKKEQRKKLMVSIMAGVLVLLMLLPMVLTIVDGVV